MREFLSKINGRLVLDENFAVPLQREYDEHLMDNVIKSRLLTPKEIVLFNYCKHFLEAYTISDTLEANGQYVDDAYLCWQPHHTPLSKSLHLLVHQLRPTCTKTWAAWRKAQQLWCNPITRKLRTPLGKWLHHSPQLRRSWKYNLDPTNNVLISTEITTGSLHVHLPLPSSPRHFYLQPSTTVQELPQSSYPVSCQPRLTSLEINGQPEEVITPISTQPQKNFENFLDSQKPVKFENGTWGWALSSPTGEELIKCKGPAYGIVMESYCAEAHGLLSITTLVTLLMQYTTNTFAPIELLSNNDALVKKVEKLKQSTRLEFPNDTLASSWDVLQ
jgi:hypothetical protein